MMTASESGKMVQLQISFLFLYLISSSALSLLNRNNKWVNEAFSSYIADLVDT